MKRHTKGGNLKLFMQWIFSYIVVLLIPMIACSFNIWCILGRIKKRPAPVTRPIRGRLIRTPL